MDVTELVAALKLKPLPVEGGLFRQSYVAGETIAAAALPSRYDADKPLSTAIYYLLTDDPDSFSALHKLPTDELYHFYLGDPVEQLLLHPGGGSERVVLGHDVLGGQRLQHLAPRGSWQGSRLLAGGRFAVMGTTMAPGFTASDYLGGDRQQLIGRYPGDAELIRALTRPGAPVRM